MTLRLVACGGVDSSGGAGLDADRDAALALGVELHQVATCHTDQDDAGVRAVRPFEGWWEEVEGGDALKFGLLPGPVHLRAAAELIGAAGVPVVVDPVIASSSGHRFLDEEGLAELRGSVCAAGPILTPNLLEAQELTGSPDPEVAAARLLKLGARAVVIKGGHGEGQIVRELVAVPGGAVRYLSHPRIPGSLRGTGCRFATALAVKLAGGAPLEAACMGASALVASRFQ